MTALEWCERCPRPATVRIPTRSQYVWDVCDSCAGDVTA